MDNDVIVTDIASVQKVCLNIAKEVHRILSAHNIRCFMMGGTLLGSIRHNGFIPWDDDMDFGIMREQYWDAISILKKELPSPFKCISYHDSKICIQESCKVMDMTTQIIELNDYSGEKEGVFIDLFPFDYSDGKTGFFSRYNFIKSLIRIQNLRFTHYSGRGLLLILLSFIIKVLLFPLNYKSIPSFKSKKLAVQTGDYLIAYDSIYGKKDMLTKNVVGNLKMMPFEDTHFWGMQEPEIYLGQIYGDYMVLPPEEKRHTHLREVKIMSNG